MTTELHDLAIRRAEGPLLEPLYRLLGEVFPVDLPMAEALLKGTLTLPNWEMFVLCRGDEIVSHVALVHMQVWYAGRPGPVTGIASVFTVPAWRREGLVRRLMEHCLAIADAADEPCILFTDLPRVYEGAGFTIIDQRHRAVSVPEARLRSHGLSLESTRRLEESDTREMDELYAGQYPDYDGKLRREPFYWSFYRCLFNGREDVMLTFARDRGRLRGYLRTELTLRGLRVTELCCAATDTPVVEALLGCAFEQARRRACPTLLPALPDQHPVWALLGPHDVRPWTDNSEVFMARLRLGHERLAGLKWSLADRF